MTMQTIVIAHAAFGHNHFSRTIICSSNGQMQKHSRLSRFRQALSAACEERYGHADVRGDLDSAHALMVRASSAIAVATPLARPLLEKQRRRADHAEEDYIRAVADVAARYRKPLPPERDVWDFDDETAGSVPNCRRRIFFISREIFAGIEILQREILRIVRHLAQYSIAAPDQVMNEGAATFVHHTIMHKLYHQVS